MFKDYILQEQQKETLIKERIEANGTDIITWKDPEKNKPEHGSEIIFIDAVGMYQGIFYNFWDGIVKIKGESKERIMWSNVYQWIYYPKEF